MVGARGAPQRDGHMPPRRGRGGGVGGLKSLRPCSANMATSRWNAAPLRPSCTNVKRESLRAGLHSVGSGSAGGHLECAGVCRSRARVRRCGHSDMHGKRQPWCGPDVCVTSRWTEPIPCADPAPRFAQKCARPKRTLAFPGPIGNLGAGVRDGEARHLGPVVRVPGLLLPCSRLVGCRAAAAMRIVIADTKEDVWRRDPLGRR